MLTPAIGSPTESLKDRDARFGAAMRAIIKDPAVMVGKDADSIKALIGFCRRRLGRMRMGGRSVPLVGLSVVLWNAQDPIELDFDLEDLLTTALGIALDPSYIWPEWGIVLAGVLICRHLPERPEDSGQPKLDQKELINQCRLRLRHLIEGHLPRPSEPVRNAVLAFWTISGPWDFPMACNPSSTAASVHGPVPMRQHPHRRNFSSRKSTRSTKFNPPGIRRKIEDSTG